MIQVFFAAQISGEEFLGIFERAAEMMSAGLQHYARITRNIEAYSSYTSSPCEFFFWILTLDVGIHILQSNNRQPDDVRFDVSCFALPGACLVWLGLPRRRDAGNHRANQPPNGEQGKIGWIKWLVWIPWVSLIAWLALCAGCHSICWMGSFMIIVRRIRSRFGWASLRLVADVSACSECLTCSKNCLMSLDVHAMVQAEQMEHTEYILCGTCVNNSSKKAIRYSFNAASRK